MLTEQQRLHVEMSRAWTRLFRRLCKQLGSKRWRFDLPTVQLLKAVKAKDEREIARVLQRYNYREHNMFWAINRREHKVIQVHCEIPNFDKDFAYTDCWGPGYENYPYLTFIGLYTPASFAEFEMLFETFLRVKTPEEIENFERFVLKRYQPHLIR